MTDLTFRTASRKTIAGTIQRAKEFYDSVIEAGGITVNQDAYSAGLDRIYDVRGFKDMHVEIENTGGANGLTYKIEKARKNFTLLADLVDADFDKDIKADTNVAFGADDISDIVDISPETTAIRIRVKRQTAGLDTILAGFVSAN